MSATESSPGGPLARGRNSKLFCMHQAIHVPRVDQTVSLSTLRKARHKPHNHWIITVVNIMSDHAGDLRSIEHDLIKPVYGDFLSH